MSQVVSRHDATRQRMLGMYGPVQQEMEQVEQLLRAELRSEDPHVDELVKYGFRMSGKRLRPALLLMSGKAAGRIVRAHVVLAAVVEMVHTATLIHDDVLDEAAIRRHRETVNARWNNESSVLLGDYLFTHALYLASTLESPYACLTLGRATNIVCEGELRQVYNRGNFDLTEDEYLKIIEAKTAELTSCCCRLGAHYAEADPLIVEALASFGRNLGIAFQIADDLLDLIGEEERTGKSLGTDLEKNKATLPVIRVLSLANEDERGQLRRIFSHEENPREALRPWLQRYGAIDYARDKARWYASRAQQDLLALDESPAVAMLRNVTGFVIEREL